jgi:uncharacterized damage-inducible protein DinB
MDPRIAPLAEILRLNRKLFSNCLDGLDEGQAMARPAPDANSAAYVAAHMVESRYYLLAQMGTERKSMLGDRVGWKSLTEITQWPSLDEVKAAWTDASTALDKRLNEMTTQQADTPIETQFPLENKTTLGMLGFLVQHDSYHLGQLSLLRKTCGLPAMSYS